MEKIPQPIAEQNQEVIEPKARDKAAELVGGTNAFMSKSLIHLKRTKFVLLNGYNLMSVHYRLILSLQVKTQSLHPRLAVAIFYPVSVGFFIFNQVVKRRTTGYEVR